MKFTPCGSSWAMMGPWTTPGFVSCGGRANHTGNLNIVSQNYTKKSNIESTTAFCATLSCKYDRSNLHCT